MSAIANGVLLDKWPGNNEASATVENLYQEYHAGEVEYQSSPDNLEGYYPLRPGTYLQVIYNQNRLLARRPVGEEPLLPDGLGNRFLGIFSGIHYKFEAAEKGNLVSLIQQFPLMSMPAVSRYSNKRYTADDLNSFVGRYYNRELDVVHDLKISREGHLEAQVNDSKLLNLLVTGEDQFGGDGATIEFIREEEEIIGFVLYNHRIKSLEFRRL